MDRDLRLNLKPMIDVTFQLLIFFMLTINFKSMEGNLNSYLPKDRGPRNTQKEPVDECRVDLRYDRNQERTIVDISNTQTFVWNDGEEVTPEMRKMVGLAIEDVYTNVKAQAKNTDRPPVKLDVTPRVPSGHVVTAVDVITKYVLDKHGASLSFAGNELSKLGK